jgi:hypothetical protein
VTAPAGPFHFADCDLRRRQVRPTLLGKRTLHVTMLPVYRDACSLTGLPPSKNRRRRSQRRMSHWHWALSTPCG